MKRLVLMIIPALICGILLTSCSTDNAYPEVLADEIEGTYVGTYTITNLNRNFSWSTVPTIELKEGKFTYKETPESVYRNVYGGYSINEEKIIFEVEYYDSPYLDIFYVSEATRLLLEGEYNYTFDGTKLAFSKVVFALTPEEAFRCEFELIKK